MKLLSPGRLGLLLIAAGLLIWLYLRAGYVAVDLQGAVVQAQLQAQQRTRMQQAAGALTPTAGAGTEATGVGPLAWLFQYPPTSAPPPATAAPLVDSSRGPEPVPTLEPTSTPTPDSTATPTLEPSPEPAATPLPTLEPTTEPTATPTEVPTEPPSPTPFPTETPTPGPLGPPVRLAFADMKIDTEVTQMGWTQPARGAASQWEVPDNTAGWAITSAQLGVPGNIVLSGHNNIFKMVFRNISLAWPDKAKRTLDPHTYSSDILNDRVIELYAADGTRFDYQVTGFYRLHDSGVPLQQREDNASYMQQTEDAELTLITCWPPWSNTYRLIVRAKLVEQHGPPE